MRFVSLIVLTIGCLSCSHQKYYENDDLVGKHFITFKALLLTDPGASRTELAQAAKYWFKEHPLTDEWVELFFRLNRDGKGTLSDHIREAELQIQMLSETDPKGRATTIEIIREHLEWKKQFAKTLENEGQDPNIYELTFEIAIR